MDMPDKAMVRVAGLVLVRQRPPTANGTVFMSLEDETGLLNLIIWPRTWERFRAVAKEAVALFIEGRVERADRALHVCPSKMDDLSHAPAGASRRTRATFVDFRCANPSRERKQRSAHPPGGLPGPCAPPGHPHSGRLAQFWNLQRSNPGETARTD